MTTNTKMASFLLLAFAISTIPATLVSGAATMGLCDDFNRPNGDLSPADGWNALPASGQTADVNLRILNGAVVTDESAEAAHVYTLANMSATDPRVRVAISSFLFNGFSAPSSFYLIVGAGGTRYLTYQFTVFPQQGQWRVYCYDDTLLVHSKNIPIRVPLYDLLGIPFSIEASYNVATTYASISLTNIASGFWKNQNITIPMMKYANGGLLGRLGGMGMYQIGNDTTFAVDNFRHTGCTGTLSTPAPTSYPTARPSSRPSHAPHKAAPPPVCPCKPLQFACRKKYHC